MNKKTKIPVIVIFAPTASGKTALTKELFSSSGSHFLFNTQIISADSRQVYKELNIGTAKPSLEFQKIIPHHLIDFLSPNCTFNVSDFVDMADSICEKMFNENKIPVICGGTGFYIRNFLYGVPKTPISDEKVRNELILRCKKEGKNSLYNELKQIDPKSIQKIHPNDEYRICRALEVFYLTGKTRDFFATENKLRERYNFLFIVLEPNREVLYSKIRNRVDLMFEQGLKKEIFALKEKGYNKETPAMKTIGYSEWFENDDEQIIKEEIKKHSCKYAKKQYTYIRDIKGSQIISYNGENEKITEIASLIKSFV